MYVRAYVHAFNSPGVGGGLGPDEVLAGVTTQVFAVFSWASLHTQTSWLPEAALRAAGTERR